MKSGQTDRAKRHGQRGGVEGEKGAMNEELEQALRHCILCYLHFFVPLFFGKAHEREVERVRKHTHTDTHWQLVQKMGVSRPYVTRASSGAQKNAFYMQMQGVNCSCVLNK